MNRNITFITTANTEKLKPFIPVGTYGFFSSLFKKYDFYLEIKPPRLSKLGDFRVLKNKRYKITVNSDLNKYAFAVTFLHELAHLITCDRHGKKVYPHGTEWKIEFSILLCLFLRHDLPKEIWTSVRNYMINIRASSCSDDLLIRTFRKFNPDNGFVHLEELSEGERFLMKGGREFLKGRRLKKRFLCKELKSGLMYRISAVTDVITVKKKRKS